MFVSFKERDEKITIRLDSSNSLKMFDEIDANKMFQHRFHDYAFEMKNKIFSFDFIYNLFSTKFAILSQSDFDIAHIVHIELRDF